MASIGEILRQERLRRGLTLDEVAARLRINARLLEALEAEQFDKLPGPFFARSFLRQYASLVGADAALVEAALAELAASAAPAAPPVEGPRPAVPPLEPSPRARREALKRWLGAVAVLVGTLAVCAVLYALWQQLHAPAAPAPERAVATAPAPALAETPPPVAAPPAAPAAPIALELRATAAAWIRVTADGRLAFEGTLQPGQSRAFQAQESMRLLTGNAGGLEALFNGQPLGPLGPPGQIRVLELTPTGPRPVERKPLPEPEPAPAAAAPGAAGA